MARCGKSNLVGTNIMFRLFIFVLLIGSSFCKIHELVLKDDDRKQITLSSFGFLKGGTLSVNITDFHFDPSNVDDKRVNFGFTLDKSGSTGLSSYMESEHSGCILQDKIVDKNDTVSVVFFKMDLNAKKMTIERKGGDVEKLVVSNLFPKEYHPQHVKPVSRREAVTNGVGNNNFLRRQTREDHNPPPSNKNMSDSPATKHATTGTTDLKTTKSTNSVEEPANKTTNDNNSPSVKPVETLTEIPMEKTSEGYYNTHFLVVVNTQEEEGLYNLFFHNCLNAQNDKQDSTVSMTLQIVEQNNGNYLSAGNQPEPTLFFIFFVLYFACGCVWLSVLRKAEKGDVFKIHYLMLAVVWVKSISCLFHGINSHFIEKSGIPDEAWAILWYIVYLTRVALMFGTILLIGAGWAFIKHMLSKKEKKLFAIFLPLQVLEQVAWVILEESDEGQFHYTTWKQIFFIVDLLCCGAILFPVVWSIRHLQEASAVDGKAAMNLNKLKLFRHFYIMVVCYIYFTRMIVYLLQITLPFRHEWLTEFFREVAVFTFFFITGYNFRPASNNPYLQVPQDSDDEIEMEEVLTKSGATDSLTKVNQHLSEKRSSENSSEGMKQRESSLEYD